MSDSSARSSSSRTRRCAATSCSTPCAAGRGRRRARVVIAPVNAPREGYVVYEDTRRAAAGRRLDRTLASLREAGIRATGIVVDNDPLDRREGRDRAWRSRRRADRLDAPGGEVRAGCAATCSTRSARRAGDRPVEHVVADVAERTGAENVLVIANETVLGEPLLDRIRATRAAASRTSFLIVCPQSDPSRASTRRPSGACARRSPSSAAEGIDAHGQIAHPIRSPRRCSRPTTSGSTRSSSRPSRSSARRGCGAISSSGCGARRSVPVEHVVVEPAGGRSA